MSEQSVVYKCDAYNEITLSLKEEGSFDTCYSMKLYSVKEASTKKTNITKSHSMSYLEYESNHNYRKQNGGY